MRVLDRSRLRRTFACMPIFRSSGSSSISANSKPGRRAPGPRRSSTDWSRRCPGLHEHGCSYGEPGGFIRRMREDEGTWLGHVLEHVAIELQNVAGEHVTFGKTRSADAPGVYTVVYEYAERDEGIAAGELGLKLPVLAAARNRSAPVDSAARRLELARGARRIHPLRAAPRARSVDGLAGARCRGARHPVAATQRPVARPARPRQVPAAHPGHGDRRARRTSRSSSRATRKRPTRSSATLGLPVPRQELGAERSAGRPRGAAHRLSGRRPSRYNGNHGRGISIRLMTDEEVAAGFHVAREHSRSVIVETYLDGDDHRLLVVNGELVAATRRTPGHVVGDGSHTVAELVEIVNQDPRRGVGHEKVLTRLELDAQAQKMLERAGLTSQSVPASGQVVYLRSTANLSTGGTATDVTDVDPPRQSRHGHARRARRRPRRRRRRFPDARHQRELPRHRRRHLRGQRGAGLPHARRAERGHAARRRGPRDRHAVPAGHAVARADRGAHRHERQDDDRAHARAHHEDGRLHARASRRPTASTSTASAPSRAT